MRKGWVSAMLLAVLFFNAPDGFPLSGEDYDHQMQRANALRKDARHEEAEKIYSSLLAENPDDVDALVGRGFCFMRREDLLEAAKADFQKVIDLSPCYVDAYYGLALVFKRTGNIEDAESTMRKAASLCTGDDSALKYLAELSWRIGIYPLARSLDKHLLQKTAGKAMAFRDELVFLMAHDWLENGSDWHQYGLAFSHRFRPDLLVRLSYDNYRRNEVKDDQAGLGFVYHFNMKTHVEYQGYLTPDADFLARQKHRPMLVHRLLPYTEIGVAVKLDRYENGWARVGDLNIRQILNPFFIDYTLSNGRDNYDRSVVTQIVKFGYERDDRMFCHIGYARGDETVDPFGGSVFSDQLVESVFFNAKYFLEKNLGFTVGAGVEYRDGGFNRTTGAAAVVSRF